MDENEALKIAMMRCEALRIALHSTIWEIESIDSSIFAYDGKNPRYTMNNWKYDLFENHTDKVEDLYVVLSDAEISFKSKVNAVKDMMEKAEENNSSAKYLSLVLDVLEAVENEC